jgi:pantoate--beta-alanine ligase
MILVKHLIDLENLMKSYRSRNLSFGFVPTMGALHPGHISLIKESNKHHPVTVCSIFVNPTQFNNTNDFIKYPITIEKDIDMLEAAGCDVLFLPSTLEMYPVNDPVIVYELGYIETLLEGKYRPGHFQGVCRIVDKLLSAVLPNSLFLGQKDYQQCMVIKKMMDLKHYPIHLQVCDTLREEDGLAMSSRNLRLTAAERNKALNLIESLRNIKATIKTGDTIEIRQESIEKLTRLGFKVDYFEIADASDLLPISVWDGKQKAVVLVAATLNDVRLIDNLLLN